MARFSQRDGVILSAGIVGNLIYTVKFAQTAGMIWLTFSV